MKILESLNAVAVDFILTKILEQSTINFVLAVFEQTNNFLFVGIYSIEHEKTSNAFDWNSIRDEHSSNSYNGVLFMRLLVEVEIGDGLIFRLIVYLMLTESNLILYNAQVQHEKFMGNNLFDYELFLEYSYFLFHQEVDYLCLVLLFCIYLHV